MTRKEYQKKICLLGDPAVGKTSLIRRYVLNVFDDKYIATVGTKITRKELVIEDESASINADMTLMIWDIVGQKEYHKLRVMYYRGANGALVVCDLTRKETLQSLREWANSLFDTVGKVPIIFLVNKADLEESREMDEEDIKKLAAEYKAPFFYTSAKRGDNVEKAFLAISKMMIKSSE